MIHEESREHLEGSTETGDTAASLYRSSHESDGCSMFCEKHVIRVVLSQVIQYDAWKRPTTCAPVDAQKRKFYSFSILKRIRVLLAHILKAGI